jgi:hypothetical protein
MRISEKNITNLAKCVFDEITATRIILATSDSSGKSVDDELFKMQGKIWKRICEVLKIQP